MTELQKVPISPEERADRIERWIADNAERPALQEKAFWESSLVRDKPLEVDSGEPEDISQLDDGSGLLPDIRTTESEISEFTLLLHESSFTPEERALQIEAFLVINEEALSDLDALRRAYESELLLRKSSGADGAGSESIIEPADPGARVPARSAALFGELERIRHELSQIEPETRASYLEVHRALLEQMQSELSSSLKQ